MLRELDQSFAELSEFRDSPVGTIRIISVEHAAKTIIRPALRRLLAKYPDIDVEVIVDYGLVDVVATDSIPGSGWDCRSQRT